VFNPGTSDKNEITTRLVNMNNFKTLFY